MKLTETTDETIDRCENVGDAAAAPDPFDPAQFRTSGVLSPQADGVRRVLTHVKVMKPPKSAFFHSHRGQDYQLRCNVIEDESAGMKELYLVLPDVAFALPGETRGKLLKLCVTRQGVPFLWAVPQYDADSNRGVNLWTETALQAAKISETKWTRLVANMAEGAYTIYTSDAQDEPDFPAMPMGKLIELAFGEARIVRTVDHPLVQRLLGRD